MVAHRLSKVITNVLIVGITVGLSTSAWGQYRRGPGISSGSGGGTGTGTESGSGLGTTGTGSESGFGLGTTGTGIESGVGGARPGMGAPLSGPFTPSERRGMQNRTRGGFSVGPGSGSRSPDSPALLDYIGDPSINELANGEALTPEKMEELMGRLNASVRSIPDDGDRALAQLRIARSAIMGNSFPEARRSLEQAARSALRVQDTTIRDLRVMATVRTWLILAEFQIRESDKKLEPIETSKFPAEPAPKPGESAGPVYPKYDRMTPFRLAIADWDRAARLAVTLDNKDYRCDTLFHVVQSAAEEGESLGLKLQVVESDRRDLKADADSMWRLTDQLFASAAEHANLINVPTWRDHALLETVTRAAYCDQFNRGLAIARSIPRSEIRTDALVLVAEGQARSRLVDDATRTYQEAATAVASIPLDDPRATLNGVLIDSLISVGRFDDARAAVSLYPDTARKLAALGAIAESQGRRGLADQARAWIVREVNPEYRPQLLRRVVDGVLNSIDLNSSGSFMLRAK